MRILSGFGVFDTYSHVIHNCLILTKLLIPVNQSLNGNILIAEGSGAATKYYIQAGADTASKKLLGKSKLVRISLGRYTRSASINVSNYIGDLYKTMETINFAIIPITSSYVGSPNSSWNDNYSFYYTQSSGILSIGINNREGYDLLIFEVYCFYADI